MLDPYQKLCLDLKNKDENVRRAAIDQLAELRIPECIPLLRHAVKKDENDLVRKAAVQALQQLGDWEGIRPALQDSGFLVRETAAEALGQLGDLEGVHLAFHNEFFRVRLTAVRALGRLIDQGGYALLLLALQDEDPQIRSAVVHELGQWGAKEELHLALQNDDKDVRKRAVQELGKLKYWEGVEQALRDSEPDVRAEAISALVGFMDRETTLHHAELAIHDPSPKVREAAYDVFGELSDQAGTKTNSDAKTFTIGPNDIVPFELFNLCWRWDPVNQPNIRPDQLALIHPLRKSIAKKACQAETSLTEPNRYYPSRSSFSKFLELNVLELDYEPVKDWLESLPVHHNEVVVISWDERTAVETTFQMFMRFWDDFCYPMDDMSVFPLSFEWVLLYWHEEIFYFGYGPVL